MSSAAVPLIDGRDQQSFAASSSSVVQTPCAYRNARGVYRDGAVTMPMKMISSGPTTHASAIRKPAAAGGVGTSVQPSGSGGSAPPAPPSPPSPADPGAVPPGPPPPSGAPPRPAGGTAEPPLPVVGPPPVAVRRSDTGPAPQPAA